MELSQQLSAQVSEIFSTAWESRVTNQVPAVEDIGLAKNAAHFLESATVLYADLDGSTKMVDEHSWQYSAEVYKSFLYCASTIIKDEGGAVTAYDGDRVMAIFIGGGDQNTRAVRCAFRIKRAVEAVVNPALARQYPSTHKPIKHVVGIDRSPLRAVRTGVRYDNDLVWVGRAANYAAKLTDISLAESTWITNDIYLNLSDRVKIRIDGVTPTFNSYIWNANGGKQIWGSDCWWNPL